jgi:dTDP-4-amino-4,6-dideoxygalactose transaminase
MTYKMQNEVVMQNIPMLDLGTEVDAIWEPLNQAIQDVLRSGRFIMGPNVKALEEALADWLGVRHAVGVNSGTDALVIGLRALGVGPGDEVITSPFTFFATAEAISAVGATPVFADIDPDTYNLDPTVLEALITPQTRAILPVHLYGQAADMTPIMALAEQYNLFVLEDVAQAAGGTYRGQMLGSVGHAGAFSFFPSKNLGAYGDGGLIATNDDRVAEAARMLRVHGARRKYYNEVIGYNSRLDELQAAILRVKLPYLDTWNAGRRRVAGRYNTLLSNLPGITLPQERDWARHVYHQYTIRVLPGERDLIQQRLTDARIASMIYYPVPVHKLPVYSHLNITLPQAEAAADTVLSLPVWPDMPEAAQVRIAEVLKEAAGSK